MRALVYCALFLLLIASGVGTIYTHYLQRKLFAELKVEQYYRDAMEDEWGRLLLERSVWAARGRIERVAREHLELGMPVPGDVVLVIP